MESKGQVLGFDLDDTVYIPTARALELFNRESLMEIDVVYEEHASEKEIARSIKRILEARHGKEDFTITTQQQMLDVLGSVLEILTFAAAALGGISLLVGGVGILTIMTIAVRERTHEIGLLCALGADQKKILWLFLGEATVLSAIGGLAGMLLGILLAYTLDFFIPALPIETPWFYLLLSELIAVAIGLIAGVIPARKAAGMDPIEALRTE
jgi:putative ABC transport system permease protein